MCVSVLIITLNEELNLPQCIQSLQWCDDIVILDSYSRDGTEDIAKSQNIRFIQRKFDNYATQRNFGLSEIRYRYNWLLMVDADEVVTSELAKEMLSRVESSCNDVSIYRMRRKDHLLGKWLKRSSGYPTWFGRLMKIGSVKVQRSINEEYVPDGKIGYLENHLLHHPFNKGFYAWLEKHNRYSTMEAELIYKEGAGELSFRSLLSDDPANRRQALKRLAYRMPGRPLMIFLGLYLLRLGFLDGTVGLKFCILRSFYEYLIDCKLKELQLRSKSLPI